METSDKKNKLIKRISRIEGQLRGVKKMIDQQKQCIDIITQITAIREAVTMLGIELLKDDYLCKKEHNQAIDEKYFKTLFKLK